MGLMHNGDDWAAATGTAQADDYANIVGPAHSSSPRAGWGWVLFACTALLALLALGALIDQADDNTRPNAANAAPATATASLACGGAR